MWNNHLSAFLGGLVIAAGLSLSACSNSNQEEVDAQANTESATPTTTTDTSTTKAAADVDGAVTGQGTPVTYEVSKWSKDKVKPVAIDELNKIQSTFGDVVTTDKNSLDYASNPATKYRFMTTDAPYLDVIDSQKYLELGWYYANPTDSDKEKQQSEAHAKKAYTLARQLMGNEGGQVLTDMLNGQIIKNQTIGNQKIELAKCEFYSCMLVLSKAEA